MADLGDYISRLVCDASKYVSGTGAAVTANKELSGSVNSIIGQIERQVKSYDNLGKTTRDWIALDQNATAEVKEHTLARLEHLEVLRKLASAANDPSLQLMNRTQQTNDPFQVGLRQMGVDRSRDAAAAARDASDPFLTGMARWQKEHDAFQQGLSQLRSNNASEIVERERHAKELHRLAVTSVSLNQVTGREAFDDDMMRVRRDRTRGVNLPQLTDADIAGDAQANRVRAARERDRQEEEQRARSDNDQRIRDANQRVRERHQSEADAERRAYTSVNLPQITQEEADREHRRRVARARQEQEDRDYAASQNQNRIRQEQVANRHRRQAENQGRAGGGWMLMEGGRAIEDFTQGSIYGGFKGGMLAASNNLSQMGVALQGMNLGTSRMAQALGTYGGLIGSAISTTVILGTVAVDAWMKNAKGAKEAKEAVDNYESSIARAVSRSMELRGIRERGADTSSVSEGSVKAQKKAIDDEQARLIEEAKERHIRDKGLGVAGVDANDMIAFRKKMIANEKEMVRAGRQERVPNLIPFNAQDRILLRARPEALTDDAIKARQEQEGKLGHELEAQRERVKSLAVEERELARIRRDAAEKEAEVGRRADRQVMMQARADDKAFEQKKLQEKLAGAKWAQGRMEDLMLSGKKDPKDREYYQAQKEYEESLRRSEKAVDLKSITPERKAELDSLSAEKRDRDMRNTKFGDMQADGQSGFSSADVRSVAGANAMVKAMRYSEQSQTIGELKRIGDILAEKQRAEADGIVIKNLVPIPTVSF